MSHSFGAQAAQHVTVARALSLSDVSGSKQDALGTQASVRWVLQDCLQRQWFGSFRQQDKLPCLLAFRHGWDAVVQTVIADFDGEPGAAQFARMMNIRPVVCLSC